MLENLRVKIIIIIHLGTVSFTCVNKKIYLYINDRSRSEEETTSVFYGATITGEFLFLSSCLHPLLSPLDPCYGEQSSTSSS